MAGTSEASCAKTRRKGPQDYKKNISRVCLRHPARSDSQHLQRCVGSSSRATALSSSTKPSTGSKICLRIK